MRAFAHGGALPGRGRQRRPRPQLARLGARRPDRRDRRRLRSRPTVGVGRLRLGNRRLEARGPELLAEVDRLPERPPRPLRKPAPVEAAQALGGRLGHAHVARPCAAHVRRRAVGRRCLDHRQRHRPHRIQRLVDPEVHRRALERVGDRGLRARAVGGSVAPLPHVGAADAEHGQGAAHVEHRALVGAARRAAQRVGQRGVLRVPVLRADRVEQLDHEPHVGVGGQLAGLAEIGERLEAHRGGGGRAAQQRQCGAQRARVRGRW